MKNWPAHIGLTFGAALCTLALAAGPRDAGTDLPKPPSKRKIDFSRDVRPILSENCWKCHGPDEEANKLTGGLRLDTQRGSRADRGGHAAIVPFKLNESAILSRIDPKVPEMRMPPPDSGKGALSKEEIEILKQWILEGGEYRKHWSFLTPKAPSEPKVSNQRWVRNAIDSFVLARLDESRLKPAPEAKREHLIRRVSLTLTGLPPTPDEIQKFLSDKSPGAYADMVDRYLASPRYGEHMARYWLDAVRYGDTHGLHLDNERAIYPYRDWVVRAFNEDLPYDQFTIHQIAGDLIPNPTIESKIATGYVRMNLTTNEGGAIEDEFLVKNTFDRVDTTSTVFLGMTAACAKCHDHKYDPISQRDYYGMFAYFNSTKDAPFDGNLLNPEPTMRAPNPEQARRLKAMQAELSAIESKVSIPQALKWVEASHQPAPVVGDWFVSQPNTAPNFEQAFDTAYGPEKPGTENVVWTPIKIEQGKTAQVVFRENAAGYVKTTLTTTQEQVVKLSFGSDDGIKVWLNGELIHNNKVLRGADQATDVVEARLKQGKNDLLAKIVNAGGPDGIRFSTADPVAERVSKAVQSYQAKDELPLRRVFLEYGPRTDEAKDYASKLEIYRNFENSLPITLVAEELAKPRDAYLLKRGEYNLKVAKVARSIPPDLAKLPPGAPRNRLGFARALVDPKNPLVSRVFVNRIWQQHFGTGIVKTSEDFGAQGEWPSHPELLDYLAATFISNGWSIKDLHRLILSSATFRQASTVDKAKLASDPENRLLSRGPRFRLDAEVLRDQALAVGGLLFEEQGGKGFKPYQPSGIWEAIGFQESNTSRYVQDMDRQIYRRSLYLFWKRTSPHPVMLTFDAPMRESCSVRRARTNTPLQALATMNEPAFVEASRKFAERVLIAKRDDAGRLDYAFRLALGRRPTEAEAGLLLSSVSRYRKELAGDPGRSGLLTTGLSQVRLGLNRTDVAAWTLIANTLFNTDEFLTQH